MTDRQKRSELFAKCKQLEAEWKQQRTVIFDNESLTDDEFNAAIDEGRQAYEDKFWPIWWNAFALQFPKRRGWFAETFAPSFGICESKRISVKQTEVFDRYCVSDENTWRSGQTYCRFADKLVILSKPRYARGYGYITIKQL